MYTFVACLVAALACSSFAQVSEILQRLAAIPREPHGPPVGLVRPRRGVRIPGPGSRWMAWRICAAGARFGMLGWSEA